MRVVLAFILLFAGSASLAAEPLQVPAKLVGHAILPATTTVSAPEDAPGVMHTSGKFDANGLRTEEPAGEGLVLPLIGQPVQGFSGVKSLGENRFLFVSDNGFGSKINSPDAHLYLHEVEVDFAAGTVERLESIVLNDPDRVLPYRIALEGTERRYLTGADLDTESLQIVDGGRSVVVGDEFGPFLVKVERDTGKVTGFAETRVDGDVVKSPDHPSLLLPNPDRPGDGRPYTLQRSRGYEGMAASPDGTRLYGMLEGPLWVAADGAYETRDGRTVFRVIEWDAETLEPTGRSFFYPVEDDANKIGDFNMVDATRALVIERDSGQGDAARACEGKADSDASAPSDDQAGCFEKPARFKRIYLIDMSDLEDGKVLEKRAYIDLLAIDDPDGVSKLDGAGPVFSFPYLTVESVDPVDDSHIVVANDNNFPKSAGRDPGVPDATEILLLEVPDLLTAPSRQPRKSP